MKRLQVILIFFAILPSLTWAVKIPPEVKKCVVFIFVMNDRDSLVPYGTGFLVNVRSTKDSLDFGYFVTAKHVLQNQDSKFLREVYLRIDRKDARSDTIRVLLFNQGKPIFYIHRDASVDLAVIPISMD